MAINRADWKLLMENDIAGERVWILPRRGVSLSVGLNRAFMHGFNRYSVFRRYPKAHRLIDSVELRRRNMLVEDAAPMPLYRTDEDGEAEELETFISWDPVYLDSENDIEGSLPVPYCFGHIYGETTESLLRDRHWFHAECFGQLTLEKFCKAMGCGFALADGTYFHDFYALVERLREMQDLQNFTGELCFWYEVEDEWKLRTMYDILLEDYLDEVSLGADIFGRRFEGPQFYPGYERRLFTWEYMPIFGPDRLNEWYTQTVFMLYFAHFAFLEQF